MLKQDEILRAIGQCNYKPGWTITASAPDAWSVTMTVRATVPNSDRDNALKGYPEVITPELDASAPVFQFDRTEDVWEWVIGVLGRMEEHETREFFRVGPAMDAPFHPHRWDGQRRWEYMKDRSTARWNPLAGRY